MKKATTLFKVLTVLFNPFAVSENIKGDLGFNRETAGNKAYGTTKRKDFEFIKK